MVIQESYYDRDVRKRVNRKIYDDELLQKPFNEISRSADGGFQLNAVIDDEFGNDTTLKITISRLEIDFIVDQIKKGLL